MPLVLCDGALEAVPPAAVVPGDAPRPLPEAAVWPPGVVDVAVAAAALVAPVAVGVGAPLLAVVGQPAFEVEAAGTLVGAAGPVCAETTDVLSANAAAITPADPVRLKVMRCSTSRGRSEEAAAAAIRPATAPEGAVGGRLCLAERHRLGAEELIAVAVHHHLVRWHHEAVAFAAAPFAGAITQLIAGNPAVVCNGRGIRDHNGK